MSNAQTSERIPQPHNVIWIFGDQHRAQMLGCMGDPNVRTPNLDRLSATGVHFDRAVCGFPLCTPFRGSLLTSRYPHECTPGLDCQLPPTMPTIAHAFRDHGYDTAYFGKWHLDGARTNRQKHFVPPERRGGFHTWIGYENNNSQWDCWVHGTGREEPQRLPGYETDCLTDLLLAHLGKCAKNASQPFFAALSVQPPHTPYVAPEEWMRQHAPADVHLRPNVPSVPAVESVARRDLAGAAAMVENLDWNVGRILARLEETGLSDTTYVVFFSDHGDMHGSHGQFRKGVPWEESIRIPFIISGVGKLARKIQTRSDVVLNHVDIAPTTLGLCGLDAPKEMRGFDYSALVRKDRPASAPPQSAYIQALVPPGKDDSFTEYGWRGIVTTDHWKYVCHAHQPWLMFNLNDDPYEQVNLARSGKFLAQRKKLHDQLRDWIAATGDAFALPEI